MPRSWALVLVVLLLAVCPVQYTDAASQIDVYHFNDDSERKRYKALIDEFRCPKCINTNLSGSDAPIAQDLRRTVHRLVVEDGYTDQEIRDFLQARYGDFVLYDPPFNARTWLIWVLPLVVLLLGVAVLLRLTTGSKEAVSLSEDDKARVREILDADRD